MVIFQLRKYNLLYTHQIGIIKTAAATISISAIYILYMFFTSQNSNFHFFKLLIKPEIADMSQPNPITIKAIFHPIPLSNTKINVYKANTLMGIAIPFNTKLRFLYPFIFAALNLNFYIKSIYLLIFLHIFYQYLKST